jgi:hypothetical protein
MGTQVDNANARAYAGMALGAVQRMVDGDHDEAMIVIGVLAKHLLVEANIDLPPTASQTNQLILEGVAFLLERPTPTWDDTDIPK